MELLEAFLLFITAVIISSIIYNRFPKIPAAFIQIALGVCLFILPFRFTLNLILKSSCLRSLHRYYLLKALTCRVQS